MGVSAGTVAVERIVPDGVVLTNKHDVIKGALVEAVFCEPIGLLGVNEDGVTPDLLPQVDAGGSRWMRRHAGGS